MGKRISEEETMSVPNTHASQSGDTASWEISRGVYIGTLWVVIAVLIVIILVAGLTVERNEKNEFQGMHHDLGNATNLIAVVGASVGIFGTVVGYFGSRQRRIIVHRVIGIPIEPEGGEKSAAGTGEPKQPPKQGKENLPAGAQDPEASYERIDDHSRNYLSDYFTGLTEKIYARAVQIANEDARNKVQTRDIAQACTYIAPGRLFPQPFCKG
jgi:hypothetical protein